MSRKLAVATDIVYELLGADAFDRGIDGSHEWQQALTFTVDQLASFVLDLAPGSAQSEDPLPAGTGRHAGFIVLLGNAVGAQPLKLIELGLLAELLHACASTDDIRPWSANSGRWVDPLDALHRRRLSVLRTYLELLPSGNVSGDWRDCGSDLQAFVALAERASLRTRAWAWMSSDIFLPDCLSRSVEVRSQFDVDVVHFIGRGGTLTFEANMRMAEAAAEKVGRIWSFDALYETRRGSRVSAGTWLDTESMRSDEDFIRYCRREVAYCAERALAITSMMSMAQEHRLALAAFLKRHVRQILDRFDRDLHDNGDGVRRSDETTAPAVLVSGAGHVTGAQHAL